MAYYVTYWPAEWVKTIISNGDKGPLSVIYGGEHRSQPPLGKVSRGDVVFPVTLSGGQLYVLAKMTIHDIVNADEYMDKVLKLEREPFMWDSYTAQHMQIITHIIPRTCADNAAIGTDGTVIVLRPVPSDIVPLIKLGPKAGAEQPLKLRNGSISINNFSGYFRRLSDESAALLNKIVCIS